MNVSEWCDERVKAGLYKAGWTPVDPAFWRQPAKWRGAVLYSPAPDAVAEYKEWRHENVKGAEVLITSAVTVGYKLTLTGSSNAGVLTVQAYAAYRGMPDAGLAIRVEGLLPTEAILRAAYVVGILSVYDLRTLSESASAGAAYDPWG